MARYQRQFGTHRRATRRLLLVAVILAIIAGIGMVAVHHHYNQNLRPVSSSTKEVHITIASGTSPSAIAQQLLAADLIRNAQTFEWYVNTHNIRDKLQAGTYSFSQSMSTAEIAEMIAAGKVATDLVTILPGQELSKIRQTFIDAGFKPAATKAALQVEQYMNNYPALANNPAGAGLEGFLYPDSYQLTAATEPSEIVAKALKEMQEHLTSDIRTGFAKQGLTVFQGVTLASIVEREVAGPTDRAKVAQVFLLRLKKDIPLGSDPTVNYAEAKHDKRYNTYKKTGLPPGPIGTISDGSLEAVANPANTDWLFFVSGDNGKTYFSHTLEQHQQNIDKYCHQNCGDGR